MSATLTRVLVFSPIMTLFPFLSLHTVNNVVFDGFSFERPSTISSANDLFSCSILTTLTLYYLFSRIKVENYHEKFESETSVNNYLPHSLSHITSLYVSLFSLLNVSLNGF